MRINSSDDLIQEKHHLESELVIQKRKIQRDVKQIKDGLKPAISAFSFAQKMTYRDTTRPLMNAVIEAESYRLFHNTHFLVRLFLPRLITNLVSNLVTDAVYLKKAIDKRRFADVGKPPLPAHEDASVVIDADEIRVDR